MRVRVFDIAHIVFQCLCLCVAAHTLNALGDVFVLNGFVPVFICV